MNIEEYYIKAATVNEARVIVALLATIDGKIPWKEDYYHIGNKYPKIIGMDADCSTPQDYLGYKGERKQMTIPELMDAALIGFKDPWEVPPAGYRLVTDDELEKYPKPDEYKCWNKSTASSWVETPVGALNGVWGFDDIAYAVPLDFEFEEPVIEMTMEELCKELGKNIKIIKK